jgi:Flp pilus assembly protein TadD
MIQGLYKWVPRLLLVMISTSTSLPAQENREGLMPPVTTDRNPRVARIRYALESNNFTLAQKEITELAASEPRSAEALFWNGYLQLRQGKYYEAIRELRRAEAVDSNVFVLKLLAVSYYGAHQEQLFLLKMRAAQQKDPADFAPYYYLGRYYDSDVSDFARAAEYFHQALTRRPDHSRSHYYLGHCYEVEQRPAQAEEEYRKAAESAERNGARESLPYQGLARLRLSANHPADALPPARQAVEFGPHDAAAHKLLARVYSDLGRNSDAVAEWKISSQLDPTDASALYRLYRGYLALGQAEEARSTLARYRRTMSLYGSN